MAAIESFAAASTDSSGKKARQEEEARKKAKAEAKAAKSARGGDAKRARKAAAKARTRDSLQALSKLAEVVDGQYRIVSQPPIVVPMRDLEGRHGMSADQFEHAVHEQFRAYRATLQARPPPPARAVRVRRHGSQGRRRRQRRHAGVHRSAAGTRRERSALPAGQGGDGLGARGSPAEEPVQAARGARRPRPAADAGRERHLPRLDEGRAGKPLPVLAPAPRHEGLGRRRVAEPYRLAFYAHQCGWTLARAHARSGDPIAIAAYLGKSDAFDQSVTDFAERYADQNERDYEAFTDAVRTGRLEAIEGV